MSNKKDILTDKINNGIKYIQELDEKMQPVLEYLTNSCLTDMEKLSPDKKFEYLIQFLNVKTESLLLLTKMKEVLQYREP